MALNNKKSLVTSVAVVLSVASPLVAADMTSLEDTDLAGISGQSGITMDLDLKMTADRISYFDDGNGIHLDGFRVGSATDPDGAAHHIIKVDIYNDASLNLDFLVEDRRIEFSDVRLSDSAGASMGGSSWIRLCRATCACRPAALSASMVILSILPTP